MYMKALKLSVILLLSLLSYNCSSAGTNIDQNNGGDKKTKKVLIFDRTEDGKDVSYKVEFKDDKLVSVERDGQKLNDAEREKYSDIINEEVEGIHEDDESDLGPGDHKIMIFKDSTDSKVHRMKFKHSPDSKVTRIKIKGFPDSTFSKMKFKHFPDSTITKMKFKHFPDSTFAIEMKKMGDELSKMKDIEINIEGLDDLKDLEDMDIPEMNINMDFDFDKLHADLDKMKDEIEKLKTEINELKKNK